MTLLPDFEYKRPKNLKALLTLLSHHGDNAAILAGGTDIIPRLKLGLKQPKVVIDIKRIDGLAYVHGQDETVRIGTLTSVYEIEHNSTIRRDYPTLYEAALSTASETLRLRGTVGGNIMQDTRCLYYNKTEQWRTSFRPCFKNGGTMCNAIKGGTQCYAVYCGDLAPALISVGASVCIVSNSGEREVPLEDIFTGDGKSPFALHTNDVLKEVILTSPKPSGRYRKLKIRGVLDYPLVSVAFSSDATQKGRLVVGAVASYPLIYNFSSYKEVRQLIEKAYEDAQPVANMPLSPLYRKRMVRVIAQELLGSTGD